MKNFVKIALIVALVLVVLGSVCCAVSLGIGFSFDEFWTEVEDGKYSFGPIESLSDIAWGNRFNWQDDGESWRSEETEDFIFRWQGEEGASPVKKLDLEVYYGSVNIVENTENQEIIQVTVEYRKKNHRRQVEVLQDSDTLKIVETGSKRSRNNDSTRITICIPGAMMEESYRLNELSLKQEAGDISVYMPLLAEKIDIKVNAGECQVESKIRALQEFKADVGAGEMDLSSVEASKVILDAGVGRIETARLTADEIYVDCGVGSIEAMVNGREQDYNYDISCGVGEVTIGDNDYAGLGTTKRIDNSAGRRMEIKCNIGEVDISFRDE